LEYAGDDTADQSCRKTSPDISQRD
jgi:hypothetical protein